MTFREKLRGLIEDHNIQTVKPGVYDPKLLVDQIKQLILEGVIGEDEDEYEFVNEENNKTYGVVTRNNLRLKMRKIVEGN